MLTDNAHKISFRNKVQHPEPGIVELLGLKHLPQLLTPDSRKPDGVHLRIHAVKLPSTSPANAAFSLERLEAAWQAVRERL